MIKGAIFDMDGLLFDTERLFRESWTVMAERFGKVPRTDFPAAVAGTSGEHMLEVVRAYYPDVDAKEFVRCTAARVGELVSRDVPEKPGVHEILDYFRECGMKLAVASSSSRAMIDNNLGSAGIGHYFDVIVSGEEVEHGKPEPDIFLLAAKRLGCMPQECYVFEDGINGARAGVAAGCATVMIPDEVPPTKDLLSGCAGIFKSLTEAKEAIKAGRL